jgi:hypothetical protein
MKTATNKIIIYFLINGFLFDGKFSFPDNSRRKSLYESILKRNKRMSSILIGVDLICKGFTLISCTKKSIETINLVVLARMSLLHSRSIARTRHDSSYAKL